MRLRFDMVGWELREKKTVHNNAINVNFHKLLELLLSPKNPFSSFFASSFSLTQAFHDFFASHMNHIWFSKPSKKNHIKNTYSAKTHDDYNCVSI